MTAFARLKLLLEPAKRVEAATLLASVVAFAWIEVAWVAAIYWLMNATVDLLAQDGQIRSYAFLSVLADWSGRQDARELLGIAGLGVIAIIFLRSGWGVLVTWQRASFVKSTESRTRQRLLSVYLAQPYSYFLKKNTAELAKNILSEVSVLVSVSILSIVNIVIDLATIVFLLGYLIWQSPVVTIVSIAVIGVALVVLYGLVRFRLQSMGERGRGVEEMMFRSAQEGLGGIKDVKILGREAYFLKRFGINADINARLHVESAMLKEAPRYGVETLAFVGLVGTMLYMIASGANVSEATGILILYGVAGFRLIPAMYRIYNGVSSFSFADAVFRALTDDLSLKGAPLPTPLSASRLATEKSISLSELRFRYEASTNDVIAGITLDIPSRSSIAFVGTTGSGKTTLVDIVLGLLEPTGGGVSIDGKRLAPENVESWRAEIGYVPQQIFLADASIRRNIAFGVDDEAIVQDDVLAAARTAHLHDFIMTLPAGYDTETGERGVRLSGGQRQRVGIARALYRRPQVLIMDEATSALDGITESIISEAIKELHGQLTMIIIAHRLTTVRHCDRIYMMDHGRIVDQGTYDELMGRNATFKAMAGAGHA